MKSYLLLSLIFGILLSYTTLGSIPVANAADMSVDTKCVEKTLVIVIMGKDGNPLVNTSVRTLKSLSTQQGIVNEYQTDSTGTVLIFTGSNTGYVWITKGGYNDQKIKVPLCNIATTNQSSNFIVDMSCSDDVLVIKVLKNTGTPIPNAKVITYDGFSQYSNEFRTDENGILELRPVFNTGKISITKSGYNEQKIDTIDCQYTINQYPTQSNVSQSPSSQTGQPSQIPGWIKHNAKWWADGTISESDFLKGVEYLIKNKIIKVSAVSQSSSQEPVPEWVKNNAKWWGEGQIDDTAFYQGIEFLANKGILNIKLEEKVITKAQTTTDESKSVNAKSFLVYENNLNENYKYMQFAKSGLSVSEQNTFLYKGKYKYTAFVDKHSGISEIDAERYILEPTSNDKIVFSLPMDYGSCWESGQDTSIAKTMMCSVNGWNIGTFSIGEDTSFEQHYELMDVMLQKFYYNKDSKFTQSTKELVKSGTFVAKKEKTYDEIINSLVEVNVISCDTTLDYVNWKGSVTSLANEPIDVFLILSGVDKNGKIVTFEKEIIFDLYPGQTEYISSLLNDVSGFNKCAYKLERVELSN